MGDAKLKCARCDIRGPASSFEWVRGMGWVCAQHPEEAHSNVLLAWFRHMLTPTRRSVRDVHARTPREARAKALALGELLNPPGDDEE